MGSAYISKGEKRKEKLSNLLPVMCTGGGQKVISFMSFFQTGKSCAPRSSLEADNKQTYAEPWPYKWKEGVCECVHQAALDMCY